MATATSRTSAPAGTSAPAITRRAKPHANGNGTVRAERRSTLVHAGSLEALQRRGVMTLAGSGHDVALFWHEGRAYAVDNRCPHMGFPLSRGFCKEGILTCYWHYARFDLKSGGTFDPFADDVRSYPVEVQDGEVWVDLRTTRSPEEERAHWTLRLQESLEQSIPLVQAKAILALRDLDEPAATRQIVSTIAQYGLRFGSRRNRSGWGDGLTILAAMANLQDALAPEDRSLALYHGARRVGEDAAGQTDRIELTPLPDTQVPPARLKQWFREFVEVRDSDAAERALRTAIAAGWAPAALVDLIAAAATDHAYRDFSHVMDTLAKAAELLDLVGWDQAPAVLPALTAQLASSTREEERNSWRHPEDLVSIVEAATAQLGDVVHVTHAKSNGAKSNGRASGATWDDALVEALLGTDPAASAAAVIQALRGGVSVAGASQALAYASALRLARFPTSNEFGDWDTALHSFTYCASLAQVAKRAPSVELARGILHGAMVVYQTRFLNVPAAKLPNARALGRLPENAADLLTKISDVCEAQGGVDEAGALAYRYLTLGHELAALIQTLGHAVLREDPVFHDFQMLEEGAQLFHDLQAAGKREAGFQVLVAIARWQAAHAPTRRATTQTYTIARRLHRGEAVYQDQS